MSRKIFCRWFLALVVVAGGLACSRPYTLSELPPATVVPYQLQLEFSSALDELYYVLSGPAQTYARFPVNARLSALLREQARRQSAPGAVEEAVLRVHIEQLQTEFEEIGQNRLREPVLIAVAGTVTPWLLAGDVDGGGDFPLPESTTKTARMTLSLQLERAGEPLGEKKVAVEHAEKRYWYHEPSLFVDSYRYSYAPVLDGIYRKTLVEVGSFVEQTLRGKRALTTAQ